MKLLLILAMTVLSVSAAAVPSYKLAHGKIFIPLGGWKCAWHVEVDGNTVYQTVIADPRLVEQYGNKDIVCKKLAGEYCSGTVVELTCNEDSRCSGIDTGYGGHFPVTAHFLSDGNQIYKFEGVLFKNVVTNYNTIVVCPY